MKIYRLLIPWLLLIWMYNGDDTLQIVSIEFDNEGLCELARQKIQKEKSKDTARNVHTVCLRYK